MSDAIDEGEELAERQVLLRQKLEGNLQRNTRRAFLASLPDSLHLYLADRQFLPMSEFAGVSPRFRITPEGFGMPSVISDSYRFCEFAWRHKVLEETQGIDARHDAEPAFFWPLDNNPIYEVEFGWVRMNTADMCQAITTPMKWSMNLLCGGLAAIESRRVQSNSH